MVQCQTHESRAPEVVLKPPPPSGRRHFGARSLRAALLLLAALAGCHDPGGEVGQLDVVWGRRGISDGRLQKPRAMVIDERDELYLVDMTARIQVFTPEGQFLRGWQTPEHEYGRPTGLSMDRQGNLLVADTHYYRVLVYSPTGELLKTIGGQRGPERGQFGFVTDVVQDAEGNYYISEYGEWDRIHKVSPDGQFLDEWGGHGSQPGQFLRPQNLEFDDQGRLWVADACNHRIQVFDTEGQLLDIWGTPGHDLGQLYYPYDLALDHQGHVYVCEYGNNRVQVFTREGKSLGFWGHEGRGEGELFNPWALELDSQGRLHVLDTNNHRVQRVLM